MAGRSRKPATARTAQGGKRVPRPKLLAGGNPQIAKADGDAPVQAYVAAMPGWKRDVGRRLDALVERSVHDARKAVRWNSPFYGIDGRGWFLAFHCFARYVKVTFFRGAALRPVPPGASKQAEVRYLDIREDDELDERQLAAWIRQAAALPGWIPDGASVSGKPTRKKAGKKAARVARKPAGSSGRQGARARIDRMIAEVGGWRGERLAEIRALVHEADPAVVEDWKWRGTPVWSHDGMYALASAHKDKVKLTFHHGAQLADPDGLFNAGLDGNRWRAIDLHEGDRIGKTALKALLRRAVAYNRTHRVPRSRGSRG